MGSIVFMRAMNSVSVVNLRLMTDVFMLTKLLVSVVFLISPAFAGMCGRAVGRSYVLMMSGGTLRSRLWTRPW